MTHPFAIVRDLDLEREELRRRVRCLALEAQTCPSREVLDELDVARAQLRRLDMGERSA
jgi:hypothetical protein